MSFRLTREQLYELVWSEPMQRIGKQIGISDVAIAKHCRRLGIPLPPRGYWNKLHAGKNVIKAVLPPRDLGTINDAELSGSLPPELRAHIAGEPGVAPAHDEDIDVLTARFAARLGKVSAPRGLANLHPVVAALLRKDETVRQELLKRPYYWEKPQFDSPIEKRRLRIINALLLAAASVGGGGSARGKRAEELHLHIGGWHVGFTLEKPTRPSSRRGVTSADHDAGNALQLQLTHHNPPPAVVMQWQDGEASLENQLTNILVGIALASEHFRRQWIAQQIEWEQQRRAELERLALEQKLEAERRERERLAAIEKAKVDALRADAAAWREAETIRAYVAAARLAAGGRVGDEMLDRWADWAGGEAARIDPFTSEKMTESIRNLDIIPPAEDDDYYGDEDMITNSQ
jgi:hypothetical protein